MKFNKALKRFDFADDVKSVMSEKRDFDFSDSEQYKMKTKAILNGKEKDGMVDVTVYGLFDDRGEIDNVYAVEHLNETLIGTYSEASVKNCSMHM